MKRILIIFCALLCAGPVSSQNRKLPIDTTVTTQHNVTVNGTSFNYTATTGTQPVWDEMGKPIASLHYTYYTRTGVKNRAARPLLISFNGGHRSESIEN